MCLLTSGFWSTCTIGNERILALTKCTFSLTKCTFSLTKCTFSREFLLLLNVHLVLLNVYLVLLNVHLGIFALTKCTFSKCTFSLTKCTFSREFLLTYLQFLLLLNVHLGIFALTKCTFSNEWNFWVWQFPLKMLHPRNPANPDTQFHGTNSNWTNELIFPVLNVHLVTGRFFVGVEKFSCNCP